MEFSEVRSGMRVRVTYVDAHFGGSEHEVTGLVEPSDGDGFFVRYTPRGSAHMVPPVVLITPAGFRGAEVVREDRLSAGVMPQARCCAGGPPI